MYQFGNKILQVRYRLCNTSQIKNNYVSIFNIYFKKISENVFFLSISYSKRIESKIHRINNIITHL